jgi:hypothetical protein
MLYEPLYRQSTSRSPHAVDPARGKHHSRGFTKMYKFPKEVNPTTGHPCLLKPARIDLIASSQYLWIF